RVELVAAAPAKGPAGARQDERVHLLRAPSLEALESRRVLAVHREQETSAPLLRGQRELTRGDEALLVRKCKRDAVLERPERRGQPCEPDNRIQHDIGPGAFE